LLYNFFVFFYKPEKKRSTFYTLGNFLGLNGQIKRNQKYNTALTHYIHEL